MAINFNVNPYYDDYDENKGFHRILFKPGVAVQARELTQLQTIMQKQVERVGKHFFEEGAMVIPGQISIDTNVKAVKLTVASVGSTNLSTLFDGENKIIVGNSTGVEALVLLGINAEGDDPPTLIVRFTKTGSNFTTNEFSASETVTIQGTSTVFVTNATQAVFSSSMASIQEGVYFAGNNFIKVLAQSIPLEKYTNTPSYRVGLTLSESIVTEIDDSTLFDNAIGTTNESAPGADRFKMELLLTKLDIISEFDQDFFELARIDNGVILKTVNRTQYNILEKTLARRTFEESGNYTVNPFRIQIREHRNNDRGQWATGQAYLRKDVVINNGNIYVATNSGTSGASAPTHILGEVSDGAVNWIYTQSPAFNRGFSITGSEENLSVGIEPGKAYINGYEIEKIATQYLTVSKARNTRAISGEKIDVTVGNYALVSNVKLASTQSVFDLSKFPKVKLYSDLDSTAEVGSARIRGVYYHSGNASLANSVFKLSLFNINLNDNISFRRDVKSFKANATGTTNFISTVAGYELNPGVNTDYVELPQTISVSTTAVTGQGTSFTNDFKIGDYIYIDSTKELRKVSAIINDYSLTISALGTTATNSKYYRAEMVLREPENTPALFSMPYDGIKETTNPIYYVMTPIEAKAVGGTLTITAANVVPTTMTTNDIVIFDRTYGGNVQSAGTLTVNLGGLGFSISGLTGTNDYTVLAPIKKTSSPKTKTSTIKSQIIVNDGAKGSTVLLENFDVYRIDAVKQIGVFANNQTGNVDITHWYTFDNGQRPTHYERSVLLRKPGFPSPTGNIRVDYRYFAHSSGGDYFDASSYNNINYEDIPVVGGFIRLSDVLDFRPTLASPLLGRTSLGDNESGFESSYLPHRNYNMTLDYQHYLSRIDKISMDFRGNIFVTPGASAVIPRDPESLVSGMSLYKLNLSPYTFYPNPPSVNISYIDNKRYTMRDIGEIEQRLQNVEYYTALSLLEQDTAALSIRDAQGLERYKNGFIVDNFEGHGVGEVTSIDYRCAIDMENNELRPTHTMNNVNLIEKFPSTRSTNGYQVTGDLITLKYTDKVLIDQPYASAIPGDTGPALNINPFAIAPYNGSLQLNPPADEWFEVEQRPDIIVDQEGDFNATVASLQATGALGTVWNAWQTQWTGTTVGGALTVEALSPAGQFFYSGEEWASQYTPGSVFVDTIFSLSDEATQAKILANRQALWAADSGGSTW